MNNTGATNLATTYGFAPADASLLLAAFGDIGAGAGSLYQVAHGSNPRANPYDYFGNAGQLVGVH